jgi:GTP-binding protein HflX
LKQRLEEVADHRANQRRGRRDLPSAALVGYTNAGKSSLLKALSGNDVFVEDRLFATLDTVTREVDVGEGYRFRLTDTVGFIRKLPHHLVASFHSTLVEAIEADLLVHVVDGADVHFRRQMSAVEEVLESILDRPRPTVLVFNKADLMDGAETAALAAEFQDAFVVSAQRGTGIGELRAFIWEQAAERSPQHTS